MRENLWFGMFGKKKFSKNLCALLLLSISVPWQAFADDQLFRETKENFAPHPYVQPDLSTGAFSFSRPIAVPPGRSGIQPDLKLSYSSQVTRQDALAGYGWSLNIPYIERLNKNGVDKLFNQDLAHSFFYSSLSGELLPIGTTTAVNGSFLGYGVTVPPRSLLAFPSVFLDFATSAESTTLESLATISPSTTIAVLPETTSSTTASTSMASTTDTEATASTSEQLTPSALPGLIDQLASAVTGATSTVVAPETVAFPATDIVETKAEPQSHADDVMNPDGSFTVPPGSELTGERTATSKRFFVGLKRDGSKKIRAEFYAHDIHYRDSRTGRYEEIDSRLATTSYGFAMTHASYQAALDTNGSQHLLSITHDGQTFAVDPLQVPKGSTKKANQTGPHTVEYPDLLAPGIDLDITTLNDRVAKEAVIKDASAIASSTGDYLEIPFLITFNGPITLTAEGKTLTPDTPLITSSAVTMTDVNGVRTEILPPKAVASGIVSSSSPQTLPIDIAYAVATSGVVMTKRIPLEFLRSATYPVRTDATFYPNAGTGATTTIDGWVRNYVAGSWSTVHDASSGDTVDPTGNDIQIFSSCRSSQYLLYRGITLFDTSAIPDDAVITGATASLYVQSPVYDAYNDGYDYITLVQSSPATTTTLSNSDFSQVGSISNPIEGIDSSMRKDLTSITGGQYLDITLNATGTTWINKAGVTKLGWREGHDATNNAIPTGTSDTGIVVTSADAATPTQTPKLEVTYLTQTITPTSLQVEQLSNPINVATSNPRFSALVSSASTTILATSYQIQVTASSTSWTSPYWDSGQKTLSSSTPSGMRTPDIYSTTTFALDRSKYYWRLKFWDQTGSSTDWSTTGDYFITNGTTDYGAKVESGDFLRYTHTVSNSDWWTVYDKRGVKYIYGSASSSQLASSSSIFRWYLDSMTDPSGNTVSYSYATDGKQIYPSKITYTSNGASAGTGEVDFLYEPRPDIATSSAAGFQVVTKQRLKQILVYTNGKLTHTYQLAYSIGDNGTRSMLASVQESGWSAAAGTTTLPAVQLSYTKSTNSWTENTNSSKWQLPGGGYSFVDSIYQDNGMRVLDLNGDALPDISYKTSGASEGWVNTGTTWATSSGYHLPLAIISGADEGVRLGDVNGDGYIDQVRSESCNPLSNPCFGSGLPVNQVYLGPGWAQSSQTLPIAFTDNQNNGSYDDFGYALVDVNGDGLADVVSSGVGYINNGTTWIQDNAWKLPVPYTWGNHDNGVRIIDVNGDGLADVVACNDTTCNTGSYITYFNTGHGWQSTGGAYWVPVTFFPDNGQRLTDVNGDGLPDLTENNGNIYLNTGAGWTATSSAFPAIPVYIPGNGFYYDRGVVIDDINGDGLPDVMQSCDPVGCSGYTRHVWLKDGKKADYLAAIANEKGGATTMTYGRTAQVDANGIAQNPSLQIPIDVVSTVVSSPGFAGTPATTTYSYRGGSYYYANANDRQMAGFASSTQVNSLGNVTRTYFHQGNGSDSSNGEFNDSVSKIGKPYRVEDLDQNGNLYSRTINKWARADYGDGRNFAKLAQTLKQVFDGDSTHRDIAASTTYSDANGNALVRDEWGEVSGNGDGTFTDIGSDGATTTWSYAASSTLATSTLSLPSRELVNDQLGVTVRDSKWFYDGLAFGSAGKGNQTQEQRLKAGSIYASTTKTYDNYGNVLTASDANGKTTTFVYDTYNLFPATSTNPLSQSTKFTYDYSTGKIATTTDVNSRVFVTKYDGLGRPIEEDQPDFVTPTTLVAKTKYTYTDSTTSPSSVLRQDYLNAATTSDLYTYLDGLGRTVQTKKKAETANGFITADTLYNNIGSVGSQSLPYFSATSSWSAPTTTAYLFSNMAYDPEGRVLTVADAVGTTTNTYSDWTLTVTDANGNKKDLVKDAWGNLAQVVEYLSPTNAATTTNTWNRLGKLTKLTDALGNVRNFSYDNLGRLLTAEDLHATAHTLFGTTTYTYDAAGNLVTLLNPRNQTINYVYDALNRPTSEDYTGAAGTEISYSYDAGTNGVGRLTQSVRQGSATSSYTYNPIGLTASEAKLISGVWATTSTTYMRSGLIDTITYPNGEQVANVYNDAGDLNRELAKKPAASSWQQVIQLTNYGPNGLPSFQDYGNNTQTTWTYDATQKYRLIHKVTVSTSTTQGVPETLSL